MESRLDHAGIKGMKWGRRRYQNKDGSLTPAGKKRYADQHDDYRKAHDRKKVSQMSDKELRERNNRLQMEQQYAQLTRKKNRGAQVVKSLIALAGTITAAEAAIKTYKRLGNTALDKVGDWVIKDIRF